MMKIQYLKQKISEAACAEDSEQASMYYESLKAEASLSDNEAHYYHGLVLAAGRQYNQAANELEQVSENSDVYEDALLWLGLEYSFAGNVEGLFRFFKKVGDGLPRIIAGKYLINVIRSDQRAAFEVYNDLNRRLLDRSSWSQDFSFKREFDLRDVRISVANALTTSVVDATTEIYRFCRTRLSDLDHQFDLIQSAQYMKAVTILMVAELLILPEDLKYSIYNDSLSKKYLSDKQGNISICNIFFLNRIPPLSVLDSIRWKGLACIMLIYFSDLMPDNLTDGEKTAERIDHMCKAFKISPACCPDLFEADEQFLINEANKGSTQSAEVLGMFYAVKSLAGEPTNLNKYMMQDDVVSRQIQASYKISLLGIVLGHKAALVFETAQNQLKIVASSENCRADMGHLSSSYLRVLELEINRLIVQPLCKGRNFRMIDVAYQRISDRKKLTANKWDTIYYVLYEIHNVANPVDEMSLRQLSHVLEMVRTTDDEMALTIRTVIRSLLNENGKKALDSGMFSQMISEDKFEKYCTSKYHSECIPVSMITDCREYVIWSIIRLSEWIKDSERRRQLFKKINRVSLKNNYEKGIDPRKMN